MGFTFIETDLGAALHVDIEQPIDNKKCPFDPSDFTQSDGKVMLTRMRSKLFQELAGRHDARHHGGNCQRRTKTTALAGEKVYPVIEKAKISCKILSKGFLLSA